MNKKENNNNNNTMHIYGSAERSRFSSRPRDLAHAPEISPTRRDLVPFLISTPRSRPRDEKTDHDLIDPGLIDHEIDPGK